MALDLPAIGSPGPLWATKVNTAFTDLDGRVAGGYVNADNYLSGARTAAALQAAFAAASAAGGGTVVASGAWTLGTLVDVPTGVNLVGPGAGQSHVGGTTFTCTASGAGLRFGTTAGGSAGGRSGGFTINGAGVATAPFRTGITVGRTFSNIDVTGAADVGALVEGAQNCTFNELNIQDCDNDCLRLDGGAGTNTFLKCEFGDFGRYGISFVSNYAAGVLPFVADYPLNNCFYNCIVEYPKAGVVALVNQTAGIANAFSDCIFADGYPVAAVASAALVRVTQPGTPFSTNLRFRDCTFNENHTAAASRGFEVGASSGVLLSGINSVSNVNTLFKFSIGAIIEVAGAITKTLVPNDYDGPAGWGPATVRSRVGFPILMTRPALEHALLGLLPGEGFARYEMYGDGTMAWGGGSGVADVTLRRSGVGTLGVDAGQCLRTGRAVTGSRPSAATVGVGAVFFDTTLNKPVFSDGTNWRDAAGTVV